MLSTSRRLPSFILSLRRVSSSVDCKEVDRFGSFAKEWWREHGELRALHSMNAVRVPWIRDGVGLGGGVKKVIDVGCGAGILAEPLARLGGDVLGIDASPECIAVAQAHSTLPNLRYKHCSIEELPDTDFDALVASEIVEHVADLSLFVHSCASKVKPSGSLFFTTLNRTYLSYALAIYVAENVLRVVPRGVHDFEKFVTPSELETALEESGCQVRLIHGLRYNPFCNDWNWQSDCSINYAVQAVKL